MSYWNPPKLTWFITGASSGFGTALARVALANGHNVIATSRNPSKTPDLVSEVESHAGSKWLKLDVDDPNGGDVITKLEAEGTQIDVLVNNAGWSLHGPAECIADDEAKAQMETNYFGPYRLIRAAVPKMRERRRGMVLNIGSGAGINGRDSMAPYAASKSAMDGLMRVMARELPPYNLRTLNVYLGAFDTHFADAFATTKTPFPADYDDSLVRKFIGLAGQFNPDGDHIKGSQALYEVVVGEGRGAGKEKESIMVLGRDMWRSMTELTDRYKHMMETFEEVCNDVYLEK